MRRLLLLPLILLAVYAGCKSKEGPPPPLKHEAQLEVKNMKLTRDNLNFRLATIQQAYNEWKKESDAEAASQSATTSKILKEMGLSEKEYTIDIMTQAVVKLPPPAKNDKSGKK